ncbi:MAG: hypothetical protein GX542_11565, partial [Rhodococcus sp.]|nr:hypothetical protein [Rhodococcus sp. (in: high G+C Gram-positive bacteria)]
LTLAAATAATITVGSASAAPTSETFLPAPTGPSPVGVTTLRLVDNDRQDPWTPGELREVPVTVHYPASAVEGYDTASYLPTEPGAAVGALPPELVDAAQTRTNGHYNAPVAAGAHPVVLFSPGYQVPRFLYTIQAESLASRGYVVISMDHPKDGLVSVFPDGRTVPGGVADSYTDAGLKKAIDTRIADAQLAIDAAETLSVGGNPDADSRVLPAGLNGNIDASRVGIYGHSIGGATATEVARIDPRVAVAVNVDGALFYGNDASPVVTDGASTPMLHLVTKIHADDESGKERFWNQYFDTPRGWSKVYALADTGHISFTDFEHFVPQWVPDLPGMDMPGGFTLGTAPRAEVIRTTTDLTAAGFDRFLRGQAAPVLDNPMLQYPLISPVG